MAKLTGRAKSAERKFSRPEELREAVIDRLRSSEPSISPIALDVADPARFSFVLNGKESSGDVTNLFGYIINYPEENADELIDRFVRTLRFHLKRSVENLVAVIRSKNVIDVMAQAPNQPIFQPLVGTLVSYGMYDTPDSLVSASLEEFPGKSPGELIELGTKNVIRNLPKLVYDKSVYPITLVFVEGNPSVTTGLLLADEFWSEIGGRISNDVFVAVPRRDQVFLLDVKFADAVPAMRKLVELTFQDGFNLLSSELYRHRNGKLEVVGL